MERIEFDNKLFLLIQYEMEQLMRDMEKSIEEDENND